MTPQERDDEDPKNDPRRAKNPFDEIFRGFGINPGEFDRMFEQMNRALQDALKNVGGFEPGKPYVHGFSFKVGPDGKPSVSEFGNRAQRPVKGNKPILSEEREPVTDLIEEKGQIAVTLEMPGVDKKDIEIRVTEQELEILVDTPERKYAKTLKLPAQVQPTTTKASYKNGVLDITIQKVKPSGAKEGHRVRVD